MKTKKRPDNRNREVLRNGFVIGRIRWNGPAARYEYQGEYGYIGGGSFDGVFESVKDSATKHERKLLTMRIEKA